jgi:hypothetical protein
VAEGPGSVVTAKSVGLLWPLALVIVWVAVAAAVTVWAIPVFALIGLTKESSK